MAVSPAVAVLSCRIITPLLLRPQWPPLVWSYEKVSRYYFDYFSQRGRF
jgi:hypothetical protein